jgi:hypothetical protein
MRAALMLLALACGSCSLAVTRSPPPSPIHDTTLPSGFPVIEGAVPMPLPGNDPGLIAVWESDRQGSRAYDFYAGALPTAGYRVIGLYPGGEVALIRFAAAGDAVWQVVIHGAEDGRVAIEVRLDRP